MSDRSLEELFERFRRLGDAAALGRVFDGIAPELQRLARHLVRDAAEAEDLVQATFLVAIEKRDAFDATREIAPWLTGILLKQASLARRSRRRVIEPDRLDSRTSDDPLDAAGARELSEALTIALAKLSAKDREVLLPLLLDGRRAVEIARELRSRPDTIHMRIHRGLARLRRLLPAGLALALMVRLGNARGLGAVRTEVLRQAQNQVGVGAGSAVAITAVAGGLVMSIKQIVGVIAVVVLVLVVGGYVAVMQTEEVPTKRNSLAGAELETLGDPTPLAIESNLSAEPTLARRAHVGVLPPAYETPFAVELELTRGDGEPARAALVAFIDATGVMASGKTNDDGLCTFTAQLGTADVYVRDDGSLPFHAQIEFTSRGRRSVILPAGRELSGRLQMVPTESSLEIDLMLSTDSAPEGLSAAPSSVFEALELMRYSSKQIVARTKSNRSGMFRFHGLPESWSGTLSLPKAFVFVDDERPTTSSDKPFKSPASALELTIAHRPRIIGRIIDAATRAPIANATLGCSLHWSTGGDMMTGERTNSDGRFVLALDYRTDAVGMTIADVRTVGGAKGKVQPIARWTGACEPRDLGDVECTFPPARSLEFRAVDPAGKALANARSRIDDSDVVEAGADGIGVFPAVPFDAVEMRIVAPGHAITSVPLSRETVSPMVVTLAPTNRLTIALPAEHAGRRDFQTALVSGPRLFGGKSRMYDSRLHGDVIGFCGSADGDRGPKIGEVRFNFSENGLVEVEDVRTGVPFSVRLLGATLPTSSDPRVLCEVEIDSLGPTEQRRVDLTIDSLVAHELRILRGRVIDEQGRPILGAFIGRAGQDQGRSAMTDFDGNFRLDLRSSNPLHLQITKRGYVPFRTHWDGQSEKILEARLSRSIDLRIELRDPRGHWVDGAKVKANIPGFGPPSAIESSSTGVFTLQDLPDGTADVSVIVAGKTFASAHATNAGVARITLPEFGRVDVTWIPLTELDASKSYQLALRPIGSKGVAQIGWTPFAERIHEHKFESVLPGEYTVGLEVDVRNDGDTNGRYVPLHPPTAVTVAAGKTTDVELKP